MFGREEKVSAIRLTAVQYVVLLMFLLLAYGLWRLQVMHSDEYAMLAEKNRVRNVPILAPRGKILDREGRIIVDNYPSFSALLLRDSTRDLNADADAIAKGLHLNPDEVRQRIREGMESERKHEVEHKGKDELMAELVKRNEFEVPDALIENQIDVRLERGLRALQAQGMRPEDMKKMDFARLRAGQREQAVQEVKASLLLDRIAEEEKIEVADAEIDREIEALATQSKQTVEAIRARLTRDGALDRIRSRIRNEKTLDFLYRQSDARQSA